MIKIAESMHYEIYKEFEVILLKVKISGKLVVIGDFYGDVEKVIISQEEDYCVMAGCGIIVYFLREPFIDYEYNKRSKQWKEWYRDRDIWIEDVIIKKGGILAAQIENGGNIQIDINLHIV